MATIHQITPFIAAATQLQPEDLAGIAAAGYQTVICNRPDGEADDQIGYQTMAQEAEKHGLRFFHVPIEPGQLTSEKIAEFTELLAAERGPVLAYCRTGTRSTCLWALSQGKRLHPKFIQQAAEAAGYDIDNLMPRLQELWQA